MLLDRTFILETLLNRYLSGPTQKLLPGAMCMLLAAEACLAQQQAAELSRLEEVVVTARFREESIQDIGGSLSAMNGAMLEREGIKDFSDIVARTPGLNLNDRGPNQNDVGMRGISSGVLQAFADTGISGPLISQFLDDIPVSQSTASQRGFNAFDFDRVEVLRGPQPTLFGEGSVGGTIRYFTRSPDLSAEAASDGVLKSGVSFTEDGGTNYEISAASSVVLVPEQLAVRGVVNYRNDDGFIDNPALGTKDINDFESWSTRIVTVYEPSNTLRFRLLAFVGEDEIGESSAVAPAPVTPDKLISFSMVDGGVSDDFAMYSLSVDYQMDSLDITSITGYYERQTASEFFCGTCTAFGLFLPEPIVPATQLSNDDESFTQELRLVSKLEGALNFTAGLYYQKTQLTSENNTSSPGFGDYVLVPAGSDTLFQQHNKIDTEQLSAFVELTYEATAQLRLIGGVRYVDEQIDNTTTLSTLAFGGGVLGFEPPFALLNVTDFVETAGLSNKGVFKLQKWLPRVSLEYDLSDTAMVYTVVANGVRNGNLNPSSAAFFASGGDPVIFNTVREFSEDEVWSSELGLKTMWLDGGMSFNVAAFYSTFKDPQVESASPFVTVVNAPELEISGVEFETQWQVDDHWNVYANGSYQKTQFQDNQLLSPSAAALGFPFDLKSGNETANTPQWSYSVGANLLYPLGSGKLAFAGHINYSYVGSRYSTVTNYPSSEMDSLELLNIRAGLEAENWSLTAFVSNAFNDLEHTSIAGSLAVLSVTGNGELDFLPIEVAVNKPRTIGLELNYRF